VCGIAGAIDATGAALDPAAMAAMGDALRARGPDDAGSYTDGVAHLEHRRLAIIDLARGRQPMATADGQLVVVHNGEIYNFRELRARLEALGHAFTSDSDTEVLLHGYRAYGRGLVDEIDGMFAFALWDVRARRLLLARDRFGKKPLYFFHDGRRLLFASTLAALLEHPLVPRALDPGALAEYLALEHVVAPRTILLGVEKLPAASWLELDAGSGRATRGRYYSLDVTGTLALDEREAADELERRLDAAVRRRLQADVPLGVLLSGGLDSGVVAALGARAAGHRLRTFSVAFDEPSFDESSHARRVATHLGTDHHEVVLTLAEAAAIVPEVGRILDEPIADGSIVPTYLLSRFARRSVTVALSGDGGDELFAGYPTYVAHLATEMALPLARPWLLASARALAARLPVSHRDFSLGFKLTKLLAGFDARRDERNAVYLGAFDEGRLRALLPDAPLDVYRPARERYHAAAGSHLERVLAQDLSLYLCHSVLAKVDRASMAASLEVRSPLLDTRVAELACALPLGHKIGPRGQKLILKRVARRLLPREIVARKKKGFGMPIGRWLKEGLAEPLRAALLDAGSLAADGLLERREVARLIDEHGRGTVDHRQRLWALLVLELWRRAQLAPRLTPRVPPRPPPRAHPAL
jgi:asparagine synthase (glutamine-hydrolysing)